MVSWQILTKAPMDMYASFKKVGGRLSFASRVELDSLIGPHSHVFLIDSLASIVGGHLNRAARIQTSVRVTLAVLSYPKMLTASTAAKCPLHHNSSYCKSAKYPLHVHKATCEPTQLLTFFMLLLLLMMIKYA